jgi:hypothetical protein
MQKERVYRIIIFKANGKNPCTYIINCFKAFTRGKRREGLGEKRK